MPLSNRGRRSSHGAPIAWGLVPGRNVNADRPVGGTRLARNMRRRRADGHARPVAIGKKAKEWRVNTRFWPVSAWRSFSPCGPDRVSGHAVDANRFKPFIEEKATAAAGRPVAIHGDLRLEWRRAEDESGWRAWVPWAEITAGDLSVANTDWGHAPGRDAETAAVRAWPAAFVVASHCVAACSTGRTPPVNLERLADGRANWAFRPQGEKGKTKIRTRPRPGS